MNPSAPRASKLAMRRACLLAILLLAAAPADADSVEPEVSECVRAAVGAVQTRYEAMHDLRARFEQISRPAAFGQAAAPQRSSGIVVFAKPGKMRWSYREPEESLVVSDGHWLWIYDPQAREAQKLPVDGGAFSGAAIQFLLGEGDVLRDFRVSAEACGPDEARLVLVPRAPAPYERLKIVADPRSGDVLETEVADLLGNVTHVAFRDLEMNVDPGPELFRFEAPPGVELIEIEPPGGG